MDKFQGMNRFLSEKLRAPTMTAHDAPDGGDQQLADAAAALADETADYPYTPPMPVPVSQQIHRGEKDRGHRSTVWLVNPPASFPGVGNLNTGGSAQAGEDFSINTVMADNFTTGFVYWPEVGVWVPPFNVGRVFRFDGSRRKRVLFETPPGLVAGPVASTSQVCRVVFYEEFLPENSGFQLPTGDR